MFAVFCFLFFSAIHGSELYAKNNDWSKISSQCSGKNQSPINIDSASANNDDPKLVLNWGRENTEMNIEVENTGDAVTFKSDNLAANLVLNGENYKIAFLKYHWGSKKKNKGSEHTIDKKQFSGEIEFVHYKTSLGSYEKAKDQSYGIVIVSVLFKENPDSKEDIKEINDFKATLEFVKKPNAKKKIPFTQATLSMDKMLPKKNKSYFKYSGSLSAPPCTEIVERIVFEDPIEVTSSFLQALRKLKGNDKKKLQDNYRKIQKINGRLVCKGQL